MVYKGTVIHGQNGENVVEDHLWTPGSWRRCIVPQYTHKGFRLIVF